MGIAIIVAWDGMNAAWLSEALASVDSQLPRPSERCLVVDSPDPVGAIAALGLDPASHGWTVCEVDRSDPAHARNIGTAATASPWLVFWDADNVMLPGFLRAVGQHVERATANVGIVYSDIEYVDVNLENGRRWQVPEWDYWGLRAGNYIDTGSAWRREAIELAGGWPEGLASFEDYALALEVTRIGWRGERRSGPPILMRQHQGSRSSQCERAGRQRRDLWPLRSLGVLSLLSGRTRTYERWADFLRAAELPRWASLYVVDNSGDPDFGHRVQQTCSELLSERRFQRISLSHRPNRYRGREDEPYFKRERHLHIARLYAEAIPAVSEDLILTLEDDVQPPPDAIRRLTEQLGCSAWGNFGAIAAAYDMGGDALCAGRNDGGWGSPIRWGEISGEPVEAGCVGGGCTLWANWALAGQPVCFRWDEGLGWDGSLCAGLHQRGYRIQVHAGVRCVHHIHGHLRQP